MSENLAEYTNRQYDMDHPLISLIDQQIEAARRRGEFDNLPGAGKPLDLTGDPKDALLDRMAKDAEVRSPVGVLREQIAASKARLADLTDPDQRKAEMKILADLQTRLAVEIEAFKRFG
ncbi:DnaJ family domain-containing protein [Yoonia sp. 2307UL14-13]|uniref:DnaJ family domain-containing protein n=1 Tax=Yoonia sp. 2307UL14-13 TaxID=3126506 RepID=UPI00309D7E5A